LLAAGGLACAPFVRAQSGRPAQQRPITIAQLIDTSPAQQDISKDFLIGSRAAWQDINARGGIRGRPVHHQSIEVDAGGRASAAMVALAAVKNNPACVALAGTAGDLLAAAVVAASRQERLGIAHIAPWLQNSSLDIDDNTFPIFAARQQQITHALKSLNTLSVQDIGVIYASDADRAAYEDDVLRTAAALKVKAQAFRANGDLQLLGQILGPGTPALLLFIGGTPELVQFTQGLERQSRQRLLIALADVNVQTMTQMGAAKTTAVIATQAVPMVTSSLPVVRSYREVLARLFDEPPTPHSLAGFIAARYASEVLNDIDGAITRQSVLAAFQRRTAVDVGGFRVAFDARRRGGSYVTQSMLSHDGRIIG